MSSQQPPTSSSSSSTTTAAAIAEAKALRRDQLGQMAHFYEQKAEIKASRDEAKSKLKQLWHDLPPELETFRLLAGQFEAEDRMEDLWSRYWEDKTPGNYDFAAVGLILKQLDLLRKYEIDKDFVKRDLAAINRLIRRTEGMVYRITL